MRRDERGFSLMEVLAAFLVLTVVITVSFTAFLERNNRLRQASEITLAYQALANEAEYIRRMPYDALVATTVFTSGTEVLAPLAPFGTATGIELIKPGVKQVTLTVRWKNGAREAKLVVMRADTGGSPLW
ncbi:MAG TPA: prepilin-type N-terminal cleavage/methylation domain-containing protein [Thermoanaerobaculia bacterium]|nr:prepilin-type N-terminal cleavage/methylation domain-containing protein [Thermoanaerobaculia bacterium]